VAANFSLRGFFVFSVLQTQAKACGYQNRAFAKASIVNEKSIPSGKVSPKKGNQAELYSMV
jgi:hypothetical protein